ncbi:MAG: IclR family transcriptional regulator [Clostridiales bacterium]|nr:IclR family transcriptional regulator [Clostridiales bacterium]
MIKTIDKTVAVLNALNEHKRLGVTQLGVMLDEDKSTIYRILATLEKHELVSKNPTSKKYKLGLGLLKYCATISADSDFGKMSRPYLQELKNITKESSHICILTKNDTAIFLDNINQDAVLNINTQIGSIQPLHCAAVAKSIVAFLPEARLNSIINKIIFTPLTSNTITSKGAFMKHLSEVRSQGYSTDDEEVYTGVRCVAAPIYNIDGEVFASVGVSGPTTRIHLENLDFYIESVKSIADSITKQVSLYYNNF